MVLLHVKKGDDSQFLYETTVSVNTSDLIANLLEIYHGRLKIDRICCQIEELAKHGTYFPPNILGLTDEQVEDLKLVDEWGNICIPSGGFRENKDPIGCRNGKQPLEQMCSVLLRTVSEAKENVSKNLVENGITLTKKVVFDQLDILRGACTIVYPMNLPPHDPIRMEFENREDLNGTHASLEIIASDEAELWFCGKQIFPEKQLKDFIGKNEKTKVVVKLQRQGSGPPGREPLMSEEDRKKLMMYAYRKQEEHKKLEEDEEDVHLNSEWADNSRLKRQFQGLPNIKWKPK